jgi:LPXTG-motif cell wall-anchored protein
VTSTIAEKAYPAPTTSNSAGGPRSGLPKTGDTMPYAASAAIALVVLAAAALALAARRRQRD